ncbi:hypothetical protein C8N47_1025 [Mangrovibacterium marinum]|uniref:Uncharacterized protein n=1 Tax=Mangrovibacterium marinum TaxID=1639118 RepID=A0A2T5C556_9BACT|nr:hypothetical protein C8N47_1025 [Mangrovibacterium marinum]
MVQSRRDGIFVKSSGVERQELRRSVTKTNSLASAAPPELGFQHRAIELQRWRSSGAGDTIKFNRASFLKKE